MLFIKLPQYSAFNNKRHTLTVGIPPTITWLHTLMLLYLSPPGVLCPRASLHSSQPLQTGVCRWQQDHRTSVCATAQFHRPRLGVQRDGAPCLASSQLPQAARISRGPVLRGGVPFRWFRLWASSLPLHQQQGGAAWVSPSELHGPHMADSCTTYTLVVCQPNYNGHFSFFLYPDTPLLQFTWRDISEAQKSKSPQRIKQRLCI